ncbi:hypothetical protein [Nocardia sp. NPDC059239]|uniref:hypothetical protein n=1 Tax=unclassified Nocardia TaxID=2637762 RepID=UPI0036C78BE2
MRSFAGRPVDAIETVLSADGGGEMGAMSFPRRAGLVVILASLALVAGCGPDNDAYVALQNAMKENITAKDHRPVQSVSCEPHVHDTMREETAHLKCVVVFTDGSSYTANAVIQNQNSGGRHNMPDSYSWDRPPSQ